MQLTQFGAHRDPQLGVQVGQRLVEQKDFGVAHNGAANRHALPLSTRELRGAALQEFVQAQHGRGLLDFLLDFGFGNLGIFEAKGHVGVDRHVRVKRVRLKHHGTTPVGGADVVDFGTIDQNLSAGGFVQPGNHAQQGGFATARRSDKDHKLAVFDVQVDAVNDLRLLKLLVYGLKGEG